MEKEEFLRILPKLIREDDEVKGAILTALSGVVATKDDIEKIIKEFDKRFEAMQKQMDLRFQRVYERFDQLSLGYSNIVEGIGYTIVKREFMQRGIDLKLKLRRSFHDEDNYVFPDTNDVEVDIFQTNPNIIGEATVKITNLDKVRSFIKKIEFVERLYNDKFQRYFITFKINDSIENTVKNLLKRYNIDLILPEIG